MRVSWHVFAKLLIVNRMFKMDHQNTVLPPFFLSSEHECLFSWKLNIPLLKLVIHIHTTLYSCESKIFLSLLILSSPSLHPLLLQWAGITLMSHPSTLWPWRGRIRVAHLPSTPLLSSATLLNESSSQLGGPLIPCFGLIVSFWRGEERGGVSEAALTPPLGIELGLAGVNIHHFSPHEWAFKNLR